MIEKKLLTKKDIVKIFKDYYLIDVEKVVLLSGGSAEIYKIDDKYILKLFQSKYKEEEVLKEIDIINYLKNKSFLTPTYLNTCDNKYILKIKERYLVVQKYIEGTTKIKFEATKEEIKECGYLHGLLVKNLLNYETKEEEKEDWYDFNTNINKLQSVKNLGNNKMITNDLNKKIELMRIFKYDLSDIDKISHYVSHGDFSYLQFIYKEDKVNAIIDFIRAKKLPIIWEIMRAYSYMDKECKDGKINIDNLILYIKEFMKSVKLNEYDLRYMPYVYMCQLLRSTYGYKEYYKNKDKESLEFAHFRTSLCEYLYENAENISKRLVKLI